MDHYLALYHSSFFCLFLVFSNNVTNMSLIALVTAGRFMFSTFA